MPRASDEWGAPYSRTFSQHKWKDVLGELYVSDTDNSMYTSGILGQYSLEILDKFGMNVAEMHKIHLFLYRHRLVESSSSLELTTKGFDVALTIEKIKNDERNRDCMFWATCVIAAAAVMGLFVSIDVDVVIELILSVFN